MTQRSSWKSINTCRHVGLAMAALLSAPVAWAQSADPKEWQLNMGRGVTQTARMAYEAHMVALWVC
ncbi:cytochrome c oxidase subunit II, partial [Xanthomonas perforans]|nr:cytochrome c oxidase subunit II [Xanthomonas perforans]